MDAPVKAPTSSSTANPPSVEVAYKRKCIALKKRLNETEAENEAMRVRNKRGWKYIQKMRLESCILLERLSNVTGMTEEAKTGVNPELRARAAVMMSNAASVNGSADRAPGTGNGVAYIDDDTEGSSEEQPATPQPQERPLRIKRARKPAPHIDPDAPGWDVDGTGPGHPSTWGFMQVEEPGPSKEEMISSFRIQTANNEGSAAERNNQSRRSSGQDLSGNGTADVPPPPPADNSTTPMDMDTKEPKVENQG